MKLFFILTFLFYFSLAHAIQFQIHGKKQEVIIDSNIVTILPQNLGQISVDFFEANHIPYQGSANGISSLSGLGNDVKIISDQEMKAYGWCFSVNGEVLDTMSDETIITDDNTIINWFYAFAHYKNGQWIKQCSPDL